ncbi:MAG: LAGLIDADG family homing endonuclease, partial [archaeon]
EKILLSDGLYKNIESIFEEVVRSRVVRPDENEALIGCSNLDIKVPSLNKKTLKVEHKRLSHVYRQRYKGLLYEVETALGRRVKVSPEHPFICMADGGVTEVKAKDLVPGTYAALLSSFNPLREKFSYALPKRFITDGGSVSLEMKYHHPKPILPIETITPELSRFMAYTIAESHHGGNHIYFTNQDSQMLNDFASISEEAFGVETKLNLREGKTPTVMLNSKVLVEFLKEVYDLEPANSRYKRVPAPILKEDDEVVSGFLRTLFDCEASVSSDRTHSCIEFPSASKELLVGIQLLLLRFGIVGKIAEKKVDGKTYYRLFIGRSRNHRIFRENIGFSLPEKNKALAEICGHGSKANIHVVPAMPLLEEARKKEGMSRTKFYMEHQHIARMERKNRIAVDKLVRMSRALPRNPNTEAIHRIAQADVMWDPVAKIREIEYDGYIYDLTVEGNHTFSTWDGLVVHNTSLANRISLDWLGEEVGTVSEIPHETRVIQKKEHVEVKVGNKTLIMNLLDMPGLATKVDYRDFLRFKKDERPRTKDELLGRLKVTQLKRIAKDQGIEVSAAASKNELKRILATELSKEEAEGIMGRLRITLPKPKKGRKFTVIESKDRAKQATEGIIEAIKFLDNVDTTIIMMDATKDPLTQVNIMLIGQLEAKRIPIVIAANKTDLPKANLRAISEAFPQHPVVGISAKYGKNLTELYEKIAEHPRPRRKR